MMGGRMQYDRQMRVASWDILMQAHSNCAGDDGGYLNLQLTPQEDGGMILFCSKCCDEICSTEMVWIHRS